MNQALLVAFEASEVAPLEAFGAALGADRDILLLSGEPKGPVGARRLLLAEVEELPPADALAAGIAEVAAGYTHVAAISNMRSKDVMPRVAGLMDAAMVSDVSAVESDSVFKRPLVAGTLLATVEVLSLPAVFTVRPAGFDAAPSSANPTIERVSLSLRGKARRVSVCASQGTRPDLTQAKVVVSGGRPLKDPETFEKLIGGLADLLGGAAGATRAAVDGGIAPNELQVGQTGKVVAPDLYIAAGISGSTQHVAGMKDSKLIVAINKDPQAPIFDIADYGLVADLFEAIPEMMSKLRT